MKKAVVILASLLMVSVAVNIRLWREAQKPPEVVTQKRTEFVTVRDTVPLLIGRSLTGELLTLTLPAADATDTVPTDTVPTACVMGDSVTVTLPVEQAVYDDSLYTAYVSGYRPRLDSITLRLPHTYTTVTLGKPARRWAIGPCVGAGWGIGGKRADFFVGVAVTWNLLP